MPQKDGSSHESLSLEECERLVLSPPPVAINPADLRNLLRVNRTVSAKHSLHSVDTHSHIPLIPRPASIEWSKSEYDSKFKNYKSQISAEINAQSEKHGSSTSEQPPLAIAGDHLNGSITTPEVPSIIPPDNHIKPSKKVVQSPKVSKKKPRQSSWSHFLCCVSSYKNKLDDSENNIISKPPKSVSQPIVVGDKPNKQIKGSTEASPKYASRKRGSSGWSKLFGRRTTKQDSSSAVLVSVNKNPDVLLPRYGFPSPATIGPNPLISVHNADKNGIYAREDNLNVDDDKDDSATEGSIASDDSSPYPVEQPAIPGEDLLGPVSTECVGKKCLVLDLDETLVHSSFKHVDNADFSVVVEIENMQHEVLVCKRPYLDEFVKEIGPLFECVMFTASLSKYADPVCDKIDSGGHLRHRLFREACVCFKGNYIKNLSVLGRDLDQICIIDNSPISFYFNRQNALQIVSWFDDPQDTALLDLIPYLKGMAAAPDVLNYMQTVDPPCSAAIAQPPPAPWLLLPPTDMNNYYDEEEGDEEDSMHQEDLSGGLNQVIAMAMRPVEPVVT